MMHVTARKRNLMASALIADEEGNNGSTAPVVLPAR
jgi:hypothetical protein